jgi:hypothetical protein
MKRNGESGKNKLKSIFRFWITFEFGLEIYVEIKEDNMA